MGFVQKRLQQSGGFGRDLRELREQRGYSIDDVARITKIHASVISALEDERFDDLKDPAFAERHVRALVTLFEGHLAYYVNKYRSAIAPFVQTSTDRLSVRHTPRRRDFFVLTHVVIIVVFFGLLLSAGTYLLWQAHILRDATQLEIFQPMEGAQVEATPLVIIGNTNVDAHVTINEAPAVVDREGHFRYALDIPRGLTTVRIMAQRRFGSPTVVTRHVSYERAVTSQQTTTTNK